MAYDDKLAARVRTHLASRPGFGEKRMFGGLCFLLNGNMCCGIVRDELMVRVGAEEHEAALALPGARPMDFTGRPMNGMVYVDAAHCRNGKALAKWVDRAVAFVETLPPKKPKPAPRRQTARDRTPNRN